MYMTAGETISDHIWSGQTEDGGKGPCDTCGKPQDRHVFSYPPKDGLRTTEGLIGLPVAEEESCQSEEQ